VDLDRKVLADIAVTDAAAFKALVDSARTALRERGDKGSAPAA
jgi:ribosomal protein L20